MSFEPKQTTSWTSVTEEEIHMLCQEYIEFCNALSAYNVPKELADELFEDGYTVDDAIQYIEWRSEDDMHEWAETRREFLKSKGLLV
jgi:hypothetical protein